MLPQAVLSTDCNTKVLELRLHHFLRLSMEEVVEFQLQGVCVGDLSTHHLIVGSLKERQVGASVEEVVLLHQDSIVMLSLSEVSDGLEVLLLEILLLKLLKDYILLFQLTESQ